MRTYVFQAALRCEPCSLAQRDAIREYDRLHPDERCRHGDRREECQDSDCWPHGPYADGGGEADSPSHCDACGVFLENPLTSEGKEFIRQEQRLGSWCKVWREFYTDLFPPEEWSVPEEGEG